VFDLLAPRAESKGVELVYILPPEMPIALRGDPVRLRQVLTNLIGNAVKFTEHGEVVVRVDWTEEAEGSVFARFEIQDTGIGIPSHTRQRLFQPFTQGDGSTTRRYGGTGLGLAISKQLVEVMGGDIGVESEAGKGSTFWFTARFGRGRGAAPELPLAGLRLLVAVDHPSRRKLRRAQAEGWGMEAVEARNGAEAVSMLRAAALADEPFDFALLDAELADTDAISLARNILNEPSTERTRLLLLAPFGRKQAGDITAPALRNGFLAVVSRPPRQAELFRTFCQVAKEDAGTSLQHLRASVERAAPAVTPAEPETGPAAILVAEDNIVNQKVALRMLAKLGYRADVAANGREALAALARRPYAVVLMDCQMPELDGFDATREIRRREGVERHTPVIAMTAHAMQGDRQRCLAAGMDDYVSKPVKLAELAAALERFLRQPAAVE
jgi:CheY-like chemotaxis protein